MIKSDEIQDPKSCFNRAKSDELVFVLLARDPAAPRAIRAWVTERLYQGINKPDDDQINEALATAEAMEIQRAELRK